MLLAASSIVSKDQEQVLVVPRALFDRLGAFQGYHAGVEPYLPEFLKKENNGFLARGAAEGDPSYKQIIPYCVFTHGDKILRYFRGGRSGEKRLVSKASLGIGGHINHTDEDLFAMDAGAYEAAVLREIQEELILGGGFLQRPVGLINDDSNEVGQVHLGVVHVVELDSSDVRPGESAISDPEFLSLESLRREKNSLETWSAIVLEHWEEIR
jgi:predicted NUDIX family phosphoesterase